MMKASFRWRENMQRRLRIIMDEKKEIQPDYKTNWVDNSHYSNGDSFVETLVDFAMSAGRDTLVLRPEVEQKE